MPKAKLFIDVDDTILAAYYPNANFDLRPAVLSQIFYLTKLFDVEWLTHRTEPEMDEIVELLWYEKLASVVDYANWREVDDQDKAPYVIQHDDFYWLEDPLSTGDLKELIDAGKQDRYIPVDSVGAWAFVRACRQLFSKAGITPADLKKIGAPAHLFNEPCADHFDWTYVE